MTVHQPKVSVIIPNYNHGKYLAKRIESVLNQTFTDFELLILDDCSQDNSQQLIAYYVSVDSRVKSLINNQNSGSVFKQWSLGFNQTKGKYIWIAESDDFAEETFLEVLLSIMEKDELVTFAYSNSWIVDEGNRIQGTTADWKQKYFNDNHWGENYITDGRQELQRYLAVACTINNASSVLFRRSSIEAVGGVDNTFRYTGDWMMYIKLSMQGRIAYKADCLSNYREHNENTSKKSEVDGSQLFERLKCFAYMYKRANLPIVVRQSIVSQASKEYNKLQHDLLKAREYKNFIAYIECISSTSFKFYVQLQINSFKSFINRQRGNFVI